MLKRMQKKKSENKGFTLVELIVVLVILAILAAILVPALLGYIDRAKGQQIVLNARSCYTAAQAELSSMYGKGIDNDKIDDNPYKQSVLDTADVPKCKKLVVGVKKTTGTSKAEKHTAYTVAYIEYQEDGDPIYFDGTAWVETAPATGDLNLFTLQAPAAGGGN